MSIVVALGELHGLTIKYKKTNTYLVFLFCFWYCRFRTQVEVCTAQGMLRWLHDNQIHGWNEKWLSLSCSKPHTTPLSWFFMFQVHFPSTAGCNGHYNCTPDLGNVWCSKDLKLSVGLVNTRREGTRSIMSLGWLSTRTLVDTSTRRNGTWLPLWVWTLTRPLGKQMIRDEMRYK